MADSFPDDMQPSFDYMPWFYEAASITGGTGESGALCPYHKTEDTMKLPLFLAITVVAASISSTATADPVSIKALFGAPQESIKMQFGDGTKHFVLMVKREGSADGSGPLAGASVTEYGWHDVNPPQGADPLGYFQFKAANGDTANIKWSLRAVFLKGEEKPRLVNSGYWELVSGTGQFKNMTGVGTLTLTVVSKTDRLFTLEGEVGPLP